MNDDVAIDTAAWQRDGYYVLPKFYSDAEIDAARDAQWNAWTTRAPRIVVDDLNTGERLRLADLPEESWADHRFKINDLFLEIETIRAMALNERITPIVAQLLGHVPVLCNSLSFEQGSSQGDHIDALYMTPRSVGHLAAIWVAMEDCHVDAGPLRYFPGSHKIPPYKFSNGSYHCIPDEMKAWNAYMAGEMKRRELAPQVFNARKGDVFIWSAYLLHGGSPIRDLKRTRKSLVFHYYSKEDCEANLCKMIPDGHGGYWMYRAHQPVGQADAEWPQLPPGVQPIQGRPIAVPEKRGWLSRLFG